MKSYTIVSPFYLLDIESVWFGVAKVRTIANISDKAIIKKYVEMNKAIVFVFVLSFSSSSPFSLSLQSGVATAYHHSPHLSVFNIRLLYTNFLHIFLYCI